MFEPLPSLTRNDMAAIAVIVYEQSGIRLTDTKMALVNARLQKRLRQRGFRSFSAYVRHVRTDAGAAERDAMVDALTTNKTSFFREPGHFRFLSGHIVPELLARGAKAIAGWSAGCSTGEEPYSIAITLLDALRGRAECSIDLFASDVSPTAIGKAIAGVYPMDRLEGIAPESLRRHFERGVDEQEGLARTHSSVRRLIRFEEANLLDARRLPRLRDFIWCRNTLMYFDRGARQRAVEHLLMNLAPHGYLFVAHAENLSRLDHDLERVAPAVYRRRQP